MWSLGHERLRAACRAGLSAYFTSTLLILLITAPLFAAQTEFPGHRHPDAAPEHTHRIQDVSLTTFVTISPLLMESTDEAVATLLAPAEPLAEAHGVPDGVRARGPPNS